AVPTRSLVPASCRAAVVENLASRRNDPFFSRPGAGCPGPENKGRNSVQNELTGRLHIERMRRSPAHGRGKVAVLDHYVRYWPKADVKPESVNVCFGPKADTVRAADSCIKPSAWNLAYSVISSTVTSSSLRGGA